MADISLKATLDDNMSSGLEDIADALNELVKLTKTQLEVSIDTNEINAAMLDLENLKDTMADLPTEVSGASKSFSVFGSVIGGLGSMVMSFINPLNLIPNMISGISSAFSLLTSTLSGLGSLISSAVMLPFQAMGAIFSTITGAIKSVVSGFGELIFFIGNLGQAFDTVVRFAQPLINIFKSIAETMLSAINITADFEKQISNVASVSSASATDMKLLSDAALKVGADTSLSASQAAEALYNLGSAGYETKDAIAALEGVAKLSEATQADLGAATEIVVSTLSQFNLSSSEATKVANSFAASCNVSMLNVSRLGEALKYVGPVAGTLGISLEQTEAVLAQLSQSGFQGEQAGTALRSALGNLLNPVGQNTDALKALGISAEQLTNIFKNSKDTGINPYAAVLDLLNSKGASTQQMMQLFGDTAGPAMMSLLKGGGDAIRDYEQKVTNTNAAFDAAKIQLDNYRGASLQLAGSLETLQILIGQTFQNSLKLVTIALTEGVNGLITFLQNTGLLISAEQLLTATTQLLLTSFSLLSPVITVINNTFTILSVALSTTISAIATFITTNELFKASFVEVQNVITLLSSGLTMLIANFLGLNPSVLTLNTSFETLKASISNFVNQLITSQSAQQSFKIILDSILSVIKTLAASFSTITTALMQFISSFQFNTIASGQAILQNIANTINSLSKYINDNINSLTVWIAEFIKSGEAFNIVKAIIDTGVKIFEGLTNALIKLPQVISTITPALLSLADSFSNAFVSLTQGDFNTAINSVFTGIINLIKDFAAGLGANSKLITDGFISIFNGLQASFETIKTSVIDPIKTAFTDALSNGLLESLKAVALKITESVKIIGTALNAGLSSVFKGTKTIGELLKESFAGNTENANSLFSPIIEIIKQGIELIKTTFNEGIPALKEVITPLFNQLLLTIKDSINFLPISESLKQAMADLITVMQQGLDTGKITETFTKLIPIITKVLNEVFKNVKDQISTGIKDAIVSGLDIALSGVIVATAAWGIGMSEAFATTIATVGTAIVAGVAAWPAAAITGITAMGALLGQYLIEQGYVWAGYLTAALGTAAAAIAVGIAAWPAAVMGAIAALGLAIYNYLIGHSLIDDIPMWFQAVFQATADYFGTVGSMLLTPFEAIWNFIKDTTTSAIENVTEVGNTIIETLAQVITDGGQIILDSFTAIWSFIAETSDIIITTATEIGNMFIDTLNEIFVTGKDIILSTVNSIWDSLAQMIDIVAEIGNNIGQSIIDGISGAIEAGKQIISNVLDGIVAMAQSVYDRVMSIVEGAKAIANAPIEFVANVAASAGEAAASLGMANGGIIRAHNGGTAVLAAEAGMNEAFVPLPDGRSIPVSMPDLSALTQSNNSGSISINFGNVNINNDTDANEFYKKVEESVSNAILRKTGRR